MQESFEIGNVYNVGGKYFFKFPSEHGISVLCINNRHAKYIVLEVNESNVMCIEWTENYQDLVRLVDLLKGAPKNADDKKDILNLANVLPRECVKVLKGFLT